MIDNNLKNAIAGEKLKHYKVNNPNLLARYVVMMSKIRSSASIGTVSYTHLRAHETVLDLVCRLLLEKKK